MSADQRLLLPVAYMGALFLLSSIPGDLPADDFAGWMFQWLSPQWQNLLHVPLYSGLTVTWLFALAVRKLNHATWLSLALVFSAIWAVLDEAHQLYVPGRYASLTDLALDLCGILLAVVYVGLNPSRLRPVC